MTTPVVPDTLLIEVCVDSVESAVAAVKGGADRLEICANLGIGGGTTPSLGLVKCIRNAVDVPLMIMIRPRIGDFLYTAEERSIMLEDIRAFKEFINIRGFVVGLLTREGNIDVDGMRTFVDEILPFEVCFHRAFDMTNDPIKALHDIDDIGGISRILTSGHENRALEGLKTLQNLFETRNEVIEDAWGLTIMPGSGVNHKTLPKLLKPLFPLGIREVHMSGGKWVVGGMTHKRNGMGMGASDSTEYSIWRTHEKEVRHVREILDTLWREYKEQPPAVPQK